MSDREGVLIYIVSTIIIFLILSIVVPYFRKKRLQKYKNNAKFIFSKSTESNIEIINNTLNTETFLEYLKSMYKGESLSDVIIELSSFKDGMIIEDNITYLKFDSYYGNIELLHNPENNNYNPEKISYSEIDKVVLDFKSFSERRGSGRSSTTYYYNQYIVKLLLKNSKNILLFDKILLVSNDNGKVESEARLIGELLAKIFKVNLVRINGEEVSYDKLDVTIIEKLKDFRKRNYSFKENPFLIEDKGDSFCINKLKYYNIPKIVIGIIFISLLYVQGLVSFNSLTKKFSEKMEGIVILFYGLFIVLSAILFVLLIILWVKFSKYKIPKLKPLIIIHKDKILNNLVYKNGALLSYDEIDISKIEDIDVRYESSKGYSIILVSDEKSYRITSFMDHRKSHYLKQEILDIIKRLNER